MNTEINKLKEKVRALELQNVLPKRAGYTSGVRLITVPAYAGVRNSQCHSAYKCNKDICENQEMLLPKCILKVK